MPGTRIHRGRDRELKELRRVSVDVAQLLESLRTEGTIDSQGSFTVDLAQARLKMSKFQSADQNRYLLSILSAAVGSGASRIDVSHQDGQMKLSMPGAYLTEESLVQVFETGLQKELVAASDLVMGLRDALDCGHEEASLKVQHPEQRSYQWILSKESDERNALPNSRGVGMELRLSNPFSRWERFLARFRRPKPVEAIEALKQRVKHCQLPVVYNRVAVNKRWSVPDFPFQVKLGNPKFVDFAQEPMVPEFSGGWSGALAFLPGQIQLVVRGVVYGAFESKSFSGLVFHDALSLDLSRENVVDDVIFQELLQQLELHRAWCLEEVAAALPSGTEELPWFLPILFEACLHDEVSFQVQNCTRNWMKERLPGTGGVASWDTGSDLLTTGLSFQDQSGGEFTVDGQSLIQYCIGVLNERNTAKAQVLQRAIDLVTRRYSHAVLLRGYLLLGLTSLFSLTAERGKAAEKRAELMGLTLSGVESELFEAHLGFEATHIASESAKGLHLVSELIFDGSAT